MCVVRSKYCPIFFQVSTSFKNDENLIVVSIRSASNLRAQTLAFLLLT